MYSFCYGDKENSPIFIGVQEIKNGQIQKFFRGIDMQVIVIVFYLRSIHLKNQYRIRYM